MDSIEEPYTITGQQLKEILTNNKYSELKNKIPEETYNELVRELKPPNNKKCRIPNKHRTREVYNNFRN